MIRFDISIAHYLGGYFFVDTVYILFQILQFISVFKYYLNTQILMLVFKYLLIVFKYLTTAYNNHPVNKYALSLITVHK